MRAGAFLHWLFCRNAGAQTQPPQKTPAQPPLTAYATIPNTGSDLALLMALATTTPPVAAPETGSATNSDSTSHSAPSPGCD